MTKEQIEQQRMAYLRKRVQHDSIAKMARALGLSETAVRRLLDKHEMGRRDPRRLQRTHAELMAKKAKAKLTKFGDVAGVENEWLHEEGRALARG